MGVIDQRAELLPCLSCGYENPAKARICSLCSEFLQSGGAPDPAQPWRVPARPMIAVAAGAAPFLEREDPPGPAEPLSSGPDPLVVLGLGAVLAPVFLLTPVLQYMGWFLASLVHELGHCLVAWSVGQPAFPAIRLDGHAAAIHQEQSTLLVVLIAAGLLCLLYEVRHRPRARLVMGALILLYPVLAFTEAHEVLHLLGGHLSELVFAGIFFFRAFSGGFSASGPERVLYATTAWYLLARNAVLTWGLMTSAAARAAYAGNGSFGLTNDFLRVAHDHLGWTLAGVARLMFLLTLLVLPVAVWIWRRHQRALSA